MKAKKENKVYTITEQEMKRYLEEGYDIYSDEGEIIEHSPKKTVKYSEYEKVLKENESLKAEVKELKKALKQEKEKQSTQVKQPDNKTAE